MIRQRVSLAVAGAVVATTAMTAGLVAPASAVVTTSDYDPGFVPTANDLVGVGSDTIEIVMHNVATAFNNVPANADGRLASFAAAPAGEITVRNGLDITRPNGSGAGKALLYGGAGDLGNTAVNFARSSSSLSGPEVSAKLKQYAFAVDGLKLAVSNQTLTHAPSTITADDMVKIYKGTYTTWGQIPGYDGSFPNATIKPYIPQSGSGTLSFFTTQLQAANGGVAVAFGGAVKPSQEHDPSVIQADPDAIAPFSTARAKNLSSAVKLVRGFSARRAVYNVVRGADVANPVAGSVGAKLVAAFGPSGFLCSADAKQVIEDAGFAQLATSANGGQCGQALDTAVSYPFVTSSIVTTETSLTGSSVGGNVTLNASIDGNNTAVGSVVFKESGTTVGTVAVNGQSKATLSLSGVPKGTKSYTASYVPTDATKFKASDSLATNVKVLKVASVGISPVAKAYGVAGLVPVSVSSEGVPATGVVTVNVGGAASSAALVNGSAAVSVPATLGVGTYPVSVTYSGDAETGPSVALSSVTVSKVSSTTTLKLSKKSIKASKKAKATVRVKIAGSALPATGKVTLKAGSKTVGSGTIKNGKATITLKKLKKGSYKIKATFAGSSNYGSSKTKSVKLKVTK